MHVDFSVGTWTHRKRPAQLLSAGGEVLTQSVAVPAASGVGDLFKSKHPALFRGCGCKKDILQVMNRWTVAHVTLDKIETVARTIANKNASVTVDDAEQLLQMHLRDLSDED